MPTINVVPMLGQHLRRRPSFVTTLGGCVLFAERPITHNKCGLPVWHATSHVCEAVDWCIRFTLTIQHGGDWERSRPQGPKKVHNFWRGTRYRHDRSRYRVQCNLCNRIMEKAKANVYANIILENSENPKKLWKSINNILHRFPAPSLAENLSLKTICEKFSNFFVDKITIIRSKFPDDNELRNVHPSYDINFLMNTLTLATEAEIKKLIMKSKSTSWCKWSWSISY